MSGMFTGTCDGEEVSNMGMRDSMEISVRAAMDRAGAVAFEEMQVDVASLATIASVAPWLGVLATLEGIVGSFRGGGGEKSAMLAALAESLSLALWPTAAGVGVAVLALAGYRLLVEVTAVWRARMWREAEDVMRLLPGEGVRWEYAREIPLEEPVIWKKYRREWNPWKARAGWIMVAVAWLLDLVGYTMHDGYYVRWAMFHAACKVGLVFTVAFAPVHVVWVRALAGSAEGRTLWIAALCLLAVVSARLA